MRRCIELGRQAKQNGDSPVGSLIACEGRILGEGIESVKRKMDLTAHAEIEAIRAACRRLKSLDLRGCSLYTTAEPCWMCSYLIRRTRVSHVVIGAPVPYVGGATSRHPILTDPKIECWPESPAVTWSELREECENLMQKRIE
ncbi:MAG: nucleoside deaminase [Acidobacteriota bacterium]|nr:nucleoside deaminase [Acidobacteriota bacterium]